jgi:hypothetical protein
LVADDSRVGWVDLSNDAAEFRVFDQATNESISTPASAAPNASFFRGLDGDSAYVRDSRGLILWNTVDGSTTELRTRSENLGERELLDAESGLILREEPSKAGTVLRIGESYDSGVTLKGAANAWDITPGGKYVLGEGGGDSAGLWDVTTGEKVADLARADSLFTPYHWIDDDTYAGLSTDLIDEELVTEISLYTCKVSTSKCEVGYQTLPIKETVLPLGYAPEKPFPSGGPSPTPAPEN